jgi:hypothetical protein
MMTMPRLFLGIESDTDTGEVALSTEAGPLQEGGS